MFRKGLCPRGFSNPTGGPWSSPWSNGNPSPQQTPAPAAVPCLNPADLFSDCFLGCAGGVITPGSPGPVCGWSWSTTFDFASDGQAILSEGSIILDLTDVGHPPAAEKTIQSELASVFGLTAQWVFDQIAGEGFSTEYIFLISSKDNAQQLYVQLVGDTGNQSVYFGEWVPTPGKTTTVSVAVDDAGVPTVVIDGISIPMVFSFMTSGHGSAAGNTTFVDFQNDVPAQLTVRKVFVASGARATETFCCG